MYVLRVSPLFGESDTTWSDTVSLYPSCGSTSSPSNVSSSATEEENLSSIEAILDTAAESNSDIVSSSASYIIVMHAQRMAAQHMHSTTLDNVNSIIEDHHPV